MGVSVSVLYLVSVSVLSLVSVSMLSLARVRLRPSWAGLDANSTYIFVELAEGIAKTFHGKDLFERRHVIRLLT